MKGVGGLRKARRSFSGGLEFLFRAQQQEEEQQQLRQQERQQQLLRIFRLNLLRALALAVRTVQWHPFLRRRFWLNHPVPLLFSTTLMPTGQWTKVIRPRQEQASNQETAWQRRRESTRERLLKASSRVLVGGL